MVGVFLISESGGVTIILKKLKRALVKVTGLIKKLKSENITLI